MMNELSGGGQFVLSRFILLTKLFIKIKNGPHALSRNPKFNPNSIYNSLLSAPPNAPTPKSNPTVNPPEIKQCHQGQGSNRSRYRCCCASDPPPPPPPPYAANSLPPPPNGTNSRSSSAEITQMTRLRRWTRACTQTRGSSRRRMRLVVGNRPRREDKLATPPPKARRTKIQKDQTRTSCRT